MDEKAEIAQLREQVAALLRKQQEIIGTLFAPDFIPTHKLAKARSLRSEFSEPIPKVLVSILAKQKEKSLPLYLECIERLEISLYIRTNNNTDNTEVILKEWVNRVGHRYRTVEFDTLDVSERVEQYRVHEWNFTRFRVLSEIRDVSLKKTIEHMCDYYFVCDVDNFVVPWTLTELVALRLPIVAPLMRNISEGSFNSNFFQDVDSMGYYKENNALYFPVLTRAIRGIVETKLVHHTYLIRQDVLAEVKYNDGTDRYEFVVFADMARRANIPQYVDNRQIYGYITSGDEFGYTLGDEEEAIRAGVTSKPCQVAVARAILEKLWADAPMQSSRKE
jgi:Glycosyl transferase family 2